MTPSLPAPRTPGTRPDRAPTSDGPASAAPAHAPDGEELLATLGPLLVAEAAAEAAGAGLDPADLEQAVWVRLLERAGTGASPARPAGWVPWLRAAVRAEARGARRRARWEVPYDGIDGVPVPLGASDTEGMTLAAEEVRRVRAAVRELPGRCPRVLLAMMSTRDATYREIAGELGISQGSLGPVRSRCLGCLRRMLLAEVAAPEPWGMER
ncbi:sigma-70 family RNA polymerase sigma factor [Streptomyces sp. 71268]|uniref:RNA polymerase sigma factor n=1 Tax=Streptomyces sp. 71268 TaxID=3002640 RepID=UPI0023F619F6|nr:sigma-70 family RNA polymerase sigma factor [Streptomyces sp. 71268]WEV24493.1 sigma-70 family RNA polymerase sigma factor [Streptomyces sp. 71268]